MTIHELMTRDSNGKRINFAYHCEATIKNERCSIIIIVKDRLALPWFCDEHKG